MWTLFKSRAQRDVPISESAYAWPSWPEEEQPDEYLERTWKALNTLRGVDAVGRKLIWSDQRRLSIPEAAKLIQKSSSESPIELIESHITEWLECE